GLLGQPRLAGLHRSAGYENRRDIEPQGRHQHAGRDLVAVRDADERIRHVRVAHVLDAVRDELARRQAVEHAVVAHRDAVVDGDRVEFLADAARTLDLADHELAEILQMHVPWNELRERVRDGDDRLAEVAVLHAGRAPQCACAGHVASGSAGTRTKCGHRTFLEYRVEGLPELWAETAILKNADYIDLL